MKHRTTIATLVVFAAVAAGIASAIGAFSTGGPGPFTYQSIHGHTVPIYGRGLYQHMSADVAVQGIGQDVVTLFGGVPALLLVLWLARNGGLRARLFLAGTLGYLFVQYLFYLVMGAYNPLFLLYAAIAGTSFFALALVLLEIGPEGAARAIGPRAPLQFTGGFLVFNALAIAMMWLGVVLPPLLDGTIYPTQLQHYTTLIVQGLDLGLLLPLSAVSGILMMRRTPMGCLIGPVYLVFLSFQMIALVGKLVAMGLTGVSIMPAIIIIPLIGAVAVGSTIAVLRWVYNGVTARPT